MRWAVPLGLGIAILAFDRAPDWLGYGGVHVDVSAPVAARFAAPVRCQVARWWPDGTTVDDPSGLVTDGTVEVASSDQGLLLQAASASPASLVVRRTKDRCFVLGSPDTARAIRLGFEAPPSPWVAYAEGCSVPRVPLTQGMELPVEDMPCRVGLAWEHPSGEVRNGPTRLVRPAAGQTLVVDLQSP